MAGSGDGQIGRRAALGFFLGGGLLLLSVLRAGAQGESGVTLLMVEQPGCRFCRMFDAEIGLSYEANAEARFAPLTRVRRGAREIADFAPVVYTPTFIVVRGGQEIGRISGYPGPAYFWSELREILQAVGYVASSEAGDVPTNQPRSGRGERF